MHPWRLPPLAAMSGTGRRTKRRRRFCSGWEPTQSCPAATWRWCFWSERPSWCEAKVASRLFQTFGIDALSAADQSAIRKKVETFDAFAPAARPVGRLDRLSPISPEPAKQPSQQPDRGC
jgi:hypothetical protein